MSGYKFYTYIHIRNDIGEVFYVGKGTGRRAFALGRNPYWNSIVAKHGHTVHIVAYFANEADAFEHEKEMIAELREAGFNLANMTDGGEGASGWVPSAETKARIGEKSKGRKHSYDSRVKMSTSRKGRKVSEETKAKLRISKLGNDIGAAGRAKISAASTGRVKSVESRAKQGAAIRGNQFALGNILTPETRAKMRIARTGKKWSEAVKAKMSATAKARWANRKLSEEMI